MSDWASGVRGIGRKRVFASHSIEDHRLHEKQLVQRGKASNKKTFELEALGQV